MIQEWRTTPGIWKEEFLKEGETEGHRKAAWIELFFDLAYVAAGVKLGDALKATGTAWRTHAVDLMPAVVTCCTMSINYLVLIN